VHVHIINYTLSIIIHTSSQNSIYLMRKFIFLLPWLLSCSMTLRSQAKVDSLRFLLNKTQDDTNKVNLFFALAEDYQYNQSKPDTALFYHDQAIKLAQKLSYTEGVFDNLFAKAVILQYNKGDESVVLRDYNQCLKIAEQMGDNRRISRAYYGMALVNDHQRNSEKFLEYVNLAYKHGELAKNTAAKIKPLLALGNYYDEKNQLDTAEFHLLKAYKVFNEMAETPQIQNNHTLVLSNLGAIYNKLGKPKEALFYFQKLLLFSENVKDIQSRSNLLLTVAQLNYKEKNYDGALNYIDKVLALKQHKAWYIQDNIVDAYLLQSDIYAQTGVFDKALEVHKIGNILRDSVLKAKTSEDMRLNTLKIQSAFDLEKKQNELKRQELYSMLIAAILGFILILTYVLYKNIREKSEQNKRLTAQQEQLEFQKEELVQVNTTKDRLFSIVAHDLRAPLGSLKALLSLWDAKILSAEKFEDISSKVKSNVNSLHVSLENLLQWSFSQLQGIESKPVRFNVYEKTNEEIALLADLAELKNIKVNNKIADDTFVEADINQIGVVVRNILSNAIKFTKLGGSIYISSSIKDGKILIDIKDQGIGMSPDTIQKIFTVGNTNVRRGTANEKGTGLGLIVVKEFIEKNNGHLTIDSTENKGTVITFSLKKG
jgi:two-component system, sensor histidine kinase and response regulator